MRKLLLIFISYLLITQAMAVVNPCEGIDAHVALYYTQKRWHSIVVKYQAELSSIFDYSTIKNWLVHGYTIDKYPLMEQLYNNNLSIAKEAGINILFKPDTADKLNTHLINKGIVKNRNQFAQHLGLSNSAVTQWYAKEPHSISMVVGKN